MFAPELPPLTRCQRLRFPALVWSRLRHAVAALREPGPLRARISNALAWLTGRWKFRTWNPPLIHRVWPKLYVADIVPILPAPRVLTDEQRAAIDSPRRPPGPLESPLLPRVMIGDKEVSLCFPSCIYAEDGLCIGCGAPRPTPGE